MKKLITFSIATAFTMVAFSQISFHLGPNISTLSGSDAPFNRYIAGYQVGFASEWGETISVQPGIFLIHKGDKNGKETSRINYLQVPLNTKINLDFGNTRIFFSYGVYVACGLWANDRTDQGKTKQNFGKDNTYRRFDIGGQLMTGIMVGRVGMNLMYQVGSRGVYHYSGSPTNTSIMLNLSYMLTGVY